MICSKDDYVQSVLELNLIDSCSVGGELWNEIQCVDISNLVIDESSYSNLPLGKFNEYIFGELLKASDRYEVKEQNLQFVRDRITIGEIDFLLFDKVKHDYIHLELATKLYLKKEGIWVGPNLRDNLNLKREKFTNQIKALQELWDNLEVKYKHPIKHVNLILGQQWEKANLNKISNYSYFPFSESFLDKLKQDEFVWSLPQKKDWLLDSKVLSNELDFHNEIEPIKEVLELNRSTLVLFKNKEEVFKCFITFWE